VAGALIGTWIAYAVVMLYTGRRSFTRREFTVVAPPLLGITAWIVALHPGMTWAGWDSLGWDYVLLFLLAAVLVRLAIGIASFADLRGGLILAFGIPVIFAGLGYGVIMIFQQPPVGHSCPGLASASACFYHPLIGESGPWIFLGLLAGIWLAYATAAGLSARRGLNWAEPMIVLPAMTAVILWALVVGRDQAGGGYEGLFVLAGCLTALLRFLVGAKPVKRAIPSILAKIGMVRRTHAPAQP